MNKKIERAKTFFLLLLILASIVLAAMIWSGDRMTGLFSMSVTSKKESVWYQENLTETFFGFPNSILLHSDGEKILLSRNKVYFSDVWNQITEAIRIFLSHSDKKAIAVSDSVWQESLLEDSIFLDYGVTYTTEFFSRIYHCEYKTDGYNFNQIIIRFPTVYSSQYAFLIRDTNTGKTYQFYVSDPSLVLHEAVEIMANDRKNTNLVFSFEVNFDKNTNSATSQTQNVLIDSMVMLNLDTSQYLSYQSLNPLQDESGSFNEAMVQSIAALFQVNAQTMRKYVDENGSITFVENYATLKIHSDGLIEYQVTDETAAPPLNGEGGPTELSADFIEQMIETTGCHSELLFNRDIGREETEEAVYGFDYAIDFLPVSLLVDGEEKDAIELTIKDNKLISYRQYLRIYRRQGTIELPASISVIDSALQTAASSEEIPLIDQMYVGYQDTGIDEAVKPSWFVHFQAEQLQIIE